MAVKIRMKRVGAKNAPVFRIVVADGRSPRDGKFIEEIGTYQPLKKGDNFKLDLDRAKYWLGKGAQPSETVASFIKKAAKAAELRDRVPGLQIDFDEIRATPKRIASASAFLSGPGGQGGSISVESQLGRGATFRVTLPVRIENLPEELLGAA